MSAKVYDEQGRRRNLAVAFRMSREENADLDRQVKLSGLTKQDYFLRRMQERDVVVQGNPRVYKALRNELAEVLSELKRIENGAKIDKDLREIIRLIAITLKGLKEDDE